MKVTNLRNRPIKIGDVVINAGSTAILEDTINVDAFISQGMIKVHEARIKERRGKNAT